MKSSGFVTGTSHELLKGLYVVCSQSLRQGMGEIYRGDRLMSKKDAQAWADELNARPVNRYSRYFIAEAK